jgi:uncharacterized membrane protein
MKRFKIALVITWVFLAAIFCTPLTGCDSLRLAPTEAQKQITYDTYLAAQTVNAQGTEPRSEAAAKLVTGTSAMLTYMGLPQDPVITDYKSTSDQAQKDAAQRPTVDDIAKAADGWLEFAIGVAGLFSGGAAIKTASWLQQLRDKAKALKEVVTANETLKKYLESAGYQDALTIFKSAQSGTQSPTTSQIVYELRAEASPAVITTKTANQA